MVTMAKSLIPRRIFKPSVIGNVPARASASPLKLMNRMVQNHPNILFAIESTISGCAGRSTSLDDSDVDAALRACIEGSEPESWNASVLAAALNATRNLLEEIEDELWHNGLQVVAESVAGHSDLRAGQRSYLRFIDLTVFRSISKAM
jgi:hypothetical protein